MLNLKCTIKSPSHSRGQNEIIPKCSIFYPILIHKIAFALRISAGMAIKYYFYLTSRTNSQSRAFLSSHVQSSIWQIPIRTLSWLMVHSFGIKLVYPGSIGFMKSALADPLQTGREKWTLEKHGIRYKLETTDGNHIDAMFFDRRNSSDNTAASSRNGKTLVVSCEGNAGFYEIGVLSTPMDAGYSVLGWNHPGFGGSTGEI